MRILIRSLAVVAVTLATMSPALAQEPAKPSQQPQQQTEYVPIDQLPPQEQLAAAPLLIGAYSFVVVVLFAYVLSVSRRLTSVHRDVARLEGELKKGT